jgi:DNA-binding MarR family transcriptional regulator
MTGDRPDPPTARRLIDCLQALARRFSIAERADISCCGITVAQAATLAALRHEKGLRLGTLSQRLGISASTLTRNLVRLRERGLVSTEADSSDRRASVVMLTDAGRIAAEEVALQEEAFARSIVEQLGESGSEAALRALERLLGAVCSATERCCPGAFDHLMNSPPWPERRGCSDEQQRT